jgi:phenylalanyl-tRNA synthetase alpha chain
VERQVDHLRKEIEKRLQAVSSLKEVEALKAEYLGRKGPLQELLKNLHHCSAEEKPLQGKLINDLRSWLTAQCALLEEKFLHHELQKQLALETIDITLPGRQRTVGRKHPVMAMLDEVLDVHREMGFSVQYGPEVESDYYNFEALNFHPDHPARDMQDTFYVGPDLLLRTQTSNAQVRLMEKYTPPMRIVSPGRCYRNEDINPRSHIYFHQVEGIYIDEKVSFAHLLQTLEELFSRFFKQEVQLRFRPSYFPFVEPGIEVDLRCLLCQGQGCALCKQTGWLEICGAGMVHPEVLKNGGIDPERYSGYAWGMGIERLILQRYGIKDIRLLADNDMRFLEQFCQK